MTLSYLKSQSAAFSVYLFHKIINYLIISHTVCFSFVKQVLMMTKSIAEEHIFANESKSAAPVGCSRKFRRILIELSCITTIIHFLSPFPILEIKARRKCMPLILNTMFIIIISQIAVWRKGIQHQMTLYCVVAVAGERTHKLRLSVRPVKNIIV
jgi:hypothetical protein